MLPPLMRQSTGARRDDLTIIILVMGSITVEPEPLDKDLDGTLEGGLDSDVCEEL